MNECGYTEMTEECPDILITSLTRSPQLTENNFEFEVKIDNAKQGDIWWYYIETIDLLVKHNFSDPSSDPEIAKSAVQLDTDTTNVILTQDIPGHFMLRVYVTDANSDISNAKVFDEHAKAFAVYDQRDLCVSTESMETANKSGVFTEKHTTFKILQPNNEENVYHKSGGFMGHPIYINRNEVGDLYIWYLRSGVVYNTNGVWVLTDFEPSSDPTNPFYFYEIDHSENYSDNFLYITRFNPSPEFELLPWTGDWLEYKNLYKTTTEEIPIMVNLLDEDTLCDFDFPTSTSTETPTSTSTETCVESGDCEPDPTPTAQFIDVPEFTATETCTPDVFEEQISVDSIDVATDDENENI
jgi:hypothetical protein